MAVESLKQMAIVFAAALLFGGVAGLSGAATTVAVVVSALGAALGVLACTRSRDDRERPRTPAPADAPSDATVSYRILQSLPLGVMLVRPNGRIRFVNRVFERTFSISGIIGADISILRANRLQDLIKACSDRQTSETLDFTLSRGGGAELKAHVDPLANGDLLVAVEDETQRKRAEELHRDFVANASHELKTPLAASAGIIETLLGHARDDPAATERFLDLLSQQTKRMTGLVEDLMSLNRIELDARVPPNDAVDLAAVVSETVDVLTPVASAQDIGIDYAPIDPALRVRGDREQLAQLFANLIDNAIKYGGPGTTVSVRPADGGSQGMTGIVVIDQGIGIEREHLPRLTERFYRVNVRRSREVGGTGLGLAIVKHVLNRHKGRLEIDSTPGEGSRFTVWLPFHVMVDVDDRVES